MPTEASDATGGDLVPVINPIQALQLCQVSYCIDPDDIDAYVKLVGDPTSRFWRCLDRSVQGGVNANLVFVARYQIAPEIPPVYAVVIRGTDVDVGPVALLQQLVEDLDVTTQVAVPWSGAPPAAMIAQGTSDAYGTITALQFGPKALSLNDYMADLLGAGPIIDGRSPTVLVTGHSLGGCLVSVVAASLAESLTGRGIASPLFAMSFAAPTAGNADYATYFTNVCPKSRRLFNSLDLVPHAWAGLTSTPALYQNCASDGIPADLLVAILAYLEAFGLNGIAYAQPGVADELPGQCIKDGSQALSWVDEAEAQHHTTTYMKILGGTDIPIPSAKVFTRMFGTRTGGVGGEI